VPAAAAVEGTLVHGMPIAFAGCRRNAGLGRSVSSVRGSFPCRRSHRRQQVSSGRMRRGTPSACAKRTHSSRSAPKKRARARGHVLRSVRRPVHVNRHSTHLGKAQARLRWGVAAVEISRSGKPAQAGGTGTGVTIDRTLRGSPCVTASPLRSRSFERVVRDASEKEGGHGHRPCEETRARGLSSVRRKQLQKSAGSIWPRISSYAALQKGWRYE